MKNKIAVLSDIHGNMTALEAVIADLQSEQATEVWLIGDLLMFGHGSHDLIELLRTLPVTVSIRGNWDDLFLEVADKSLPLEDASDLYIARMAQYLMENMTTEDIAAVRNLPLTAKCERMGIKFAMSHHLPQQNWGRVLLPANPQENFDQLFSGIDADVAIYGHVHHQLMRYSSQEQIIINPGTVGQPFQNWVGFKKDLRAQYALLEVNEFGISNIQLKKVAYDVDKEVSRARAKKLPYVDLYEESLKEGQVHTHDLEFLETYHAKTDYEADVERYFRRE